ncbi:hypothetical protein [Enterovirga sp. CN4-39]|uniref:hypothetical protein n=1 Tax=Enterovirga sp. CN4-39 TaxID=3400910 RepID=UPI003C050B15
MTQNRFEQVDERPDDAMTLVLGRDGEKQYGIIDCPRSASQGRLPKDFSSGELPLKEAFRSAIRLANDFKVPLVVMDPDGLWQPDWGKLYRYGDDEEPAGE